MHSKELKEWNGRNEGKITQSKARRKQSAKQEIKWKETEMKDESAQIINNKHKRPEQEGNKDGKKEQTRKKQRKQENHNDRLHQNHPAQQQRRSKRRRITTTIHCAMPNEFLCAEAAATDGVQCF